MRRAQLAVESGRNMVAGKKSIRSVKSPRTRRSRQGRQNQARPKTRADAKAYYRARMIEAAIEGIARHGFSGLSVSRLVEYSGLSRGMVNLHFERKQALLLQVLEHLANVYRAGWQAAVERAGDDSAARLAALIEYDVMRDGHPSNTLTAWLAFRQEAITNPIYRPLCDTREAKYFGTVRSLCAAIIKQGRYAIEADVAALGIVFLLEGLWLDWAIDPKRYRPALARKTCRAYLAAVFPRHFGKGAQR